MDMYVVVAHVNYTTVDGWHGQRQVPAFYVYAANETHALRQSEAIVHDVIGAGDPQRACEVIVSVTLQRDAMPIVSLYADDIASVNA